MQLRFFVLPRGTKRSIDFKMKKRSRDSATWRSSRCDFNLASAIDLEATNSMRWLDPRSQKYRSLRAIAAGPGSTSTQATSSMECTNLLRPAAFLLLLLLTAAAVSPADASVAKKFAGLYTGSDPYEFANRSSAAAACAATAGRFPRLCDKAELEGYTLCAVGWCADWEGYWMAHALKGCGAAGFNSVPPGTLAGAYCCPPRPSAVKGVRVSPTRFATAGGDGGDEDSENNEVSHDGHGCCTYFVQVFMSTYFF
eukprot:SAG11_NODE_3740_length_2255_cov_2.157236_1_plen_254_part_00